ncbi:hypothetical protein OFY17_11370 [Marinomonas sp. C2222]|uniref:Outer membrane protein beta-barrel domain-containing protein n=1 Tax=Marinomonas sargassi TaxID=2984494 RepID=A0ABT2YUA6_9GAMM|nr:hypothetical protein [Marinomonas sargassi]MCV2403479.1 hypothetical protein [Marinomonas sargassi]
MRKLLLATLFLVSASASAEGQIASLVTFESTALRPDSNESENVTSTLNTSMEFTLPSNVSLYGGFTFVLGENFESAISFGSRYYSSTPAFQLFASVPMWSYLGAGVSFLDETVYYPEAGFRLATSNTSRIDVYMKIFNSSHDRYDKHILVGAGLTF